MPIDPVDSLVTSLNLTAATIWTLLTGQPRDRRGSSRQRRRRYAYTRLRGEELEPLLLLNGLGLTAADPAANDAGLASVALLGSSQGSPSAATSYTFTGPSSISFGNFTSGTYTITPNGTYTGTITVSANVYAMGFIPAGGSFVQQEYTFTWNNSSAPQTFTMQQHDVWNPDASGAMHATITASSGGALTDPAPLPITVTARPVDLSSPYSEQMYQESGGVANMTITGTWTTTNGESPTALEASWNGGPWTTIWTNTSNATGTAVPFTGTLSAQAVGSGDFSIRWANDHTMAQTAINVSVGDVDPDPFQAPILPTTFSVPYSLPVGGTIWNIGTLPGEPTVGDSNALQYALHNCKLGDVIVLTAGATYVGLTTSTGSTSGPGSNGSLNDIASFRLEPKTGSGWVYITTSDYAGLPAPGTRVNPSNLGSMATIEAYPTPNGFSAIMSVGAANNYRFVGIQFLATDNCYNLVALGQVASSWDASLYDPSLGPATDTNQLPHDIVFDRCIMQETNASAALQCGLLMNGSYIAVMDSYIAGCHSTAEANCIFCWNGPGPFLITNDYLEATASAIFFGANDPTITTSNGSPYELVPSDIVITGNDFEKLAIHNPNDPSFDGNYWLIKNQFEIKSAQRVLLSGNVMEDSYGLGAGQDATAIVLTPRNSNGDAPYSVCQDITITNNIVRGTGQGFKITGPDIHDMWLYAGTEATRRISITNNIFDGVSDYYEYPAYPGVAATFGTFDAVNRDDGGPIDLVVSHNTFLFGPNVVNQSCSFNIATGVVTCPNNGLRDGQKIIFSGTLPTGLTAGVTYWAHVLDANTFTVWGSVAYTSSNAYYVYPLQFSNQITFSGVDNGGGKLEERFGYYAFTWQSGSGPPMTGAVSFHFDNNIFDLGEYGILVENSLSGTDGMDLVLKNYTFQGNVLIGNYNSATYATRGATPDYNAADVTDVGFTDFATQDYQLTTASPYKNAGSDGTDPGINWSLVTAATQNTISGQPSGTGTVNQPPTGANKTITTLQNTAYTFATSDFGFSDPNNIPPNNFLAVMITTLPTAGTLADNGVAVTADQFIAVTDITAGLLTFTPGANANGTAYTSFTFQVEDDGGTANGGANLDPSPKTMTVNVTAVNQAPTGANKTITTLENTAYTFASSDFGFSDPHNSPPNNFLAVKISTLPAAGTLSDNGVAVAAGQFIAVADITGSKLKFTPATGASGAAYASFTFQVEDDGGTASGGVNLDPSPKTMTVNVTAVNQAPTGANKTITTLENTAYTFATSDFGFSDPHNSPPNNFLAVKITTLPTAGTLTDNGVAITAGQFIAVSDITARLLKFTPATGASGAAYTSFTFQVEDDGGTANGGQNLDPSRKTMTANVTAVNQAPTGANKTITTLENTAYMFAASDFGFSDPNNSPPNNFLAVKITTLPAAGTLTENGVAVTAGEFIAVTDITGLLKFTPAANASGTPYASFTFQVEDDGGTANGGQNLDPSPKTMTVNVTAVNSVVTVTSFTPAGGSTNIATNATVNVAFNEALNPTTVNASTVQLLTGITPVTTNLWNGAATPTTVDSGDSGAVEVGVKFTAEANGVVTGLWFYKSAANSGTHVANLWSSTGTLLATATFTNEGGNGWQHVNFATPVAVTAGTTYVASYHTTTGHYSVTRNYFASPFNSGLLQVPANGGVYRYGAGGFPTQSFQGSNYWVDVSMTTTPPPRSAVPASVSYNANTNTVTISPNATLANSAQYTVAVMGGANGVKDMSGNPLAANVTSSFSTMAAPVSGSLWNATATPAIVNSGDSAAVTVGVKFTAGVNGFITGLSFYKSAANTGTHVADLWSSAGALLAAATFTNEGASGWQHVNFATPVAVTAGTTYVASYHTNAGHYSVTRNYFGSPFTSGLLHVPANGSVYSYGAGGFPTQSFQGSNYWVDVSFST